MSLMLTRTAHSDDSSDVGRCPCSD